MEAVGRHWVRQPQEPVSQNRDGWRMVWGWEEAGQTNKSQHSYKLGARRGSASTGNFKIDQKGRQQGREMVRRTKVDLKSQPHHCFTMDTMI